LNISSKISIEQLLESTLCKKIIIEVGFGDGEHLIQSAITNPKTLFVGSEVYVNGVAKVLKKILEHDIKNIRLCGMNFIYLLKTLDQNSIDEIQIINPDPWHKKRHFKRRLVNLENIIKIIRVVKNKYSSYITTDSESYFDYINEIFISNSKIIHLNKNKILSKNDRLYGVSRYQRKAIKNGEKIYQLTF
tara:strand:- start:9 stop:578 length:570 start_codon:yes stop_codon:yes gene_type:complete